jgi:hypothetical protein
MNKKTGGRSRALPHKTGTKPGNTAKTIQCAPFCRAVRHSRGRRFRKPENNPPAQPPGETGGPMAMLKDARTLGELCLGAARRYKSRKALELCRGDRLLETVNYRTLALRSLQLAGLFHRLGLRRGDRIMILAEACPQWPMAAFGAAMAGMAFLPVDPRPAAGDAPAGNAGGWVRDLGERAAVKALCVTGGAGERAAGPGVPQIRLDRFPADQGGILVSLGGVLKRLPLENSPRPGLWGSAETGGTGKDEPAVFWPGGTESSHGELLSLAAGREGLPRLFPRDRIIPLSSLAEGGTLVLGLLAAVLGGASLSLIAPGGASGEISGKIPGENSGGTPRTGGGPQNAELRRTVELLRPSVLIGEAAFLEALYRDKAAPPAEGPLARNLLRRALAQYLGGRALIKALGGNVRFFGLTGAPGPELEGALNRARLPWGRIPSPAGGSPGRRLD